MKTTHAAWPALALAALIAGRWVWIHQRGPAQEQSQEQPHEHAPRETQAAPYTDTARALLGGLSLEDPIVDDWAAGALEGERPDGRVRVWAKRAGTEVGFDVWVIPGTSNTAAALTERWHLTYSPAPREAGVTTREYLAVVNALANRVRAAEGS